MKKADIFFNGQIIQTVEFEKFEFPTREDVILLTKGYGDNKVIIAIVPSSHLIITK